MLNRYKTLTAATLLAGFSMAHATGLATCDSGPRSGWQPTEKLEQQLKEQAED